MKKIILPVISAITLFFLLTACGGERVVMKDIFPTVESVNQKLSALGNITDEDSAKETGLYIPNGYHLMEHLIEQ